MRINFEKLYLNKTKNSIKKIFNNSNYSKLYQFFIYFIIFKLYLIHFYYFCVTAKIFDKMKLQNFFANSFFFQPPFFKKQMHLTFNTE